ncbi:MAG TPA: hypothetical protein VJZ76_06900 [Thermoanaerobaculia bacterium]|nr:hypothetical protein [Thermoanaerobaculia bacterium]
MPLFHLTGDRFDPIDAARFDALQVRERRDLQRILRSKLDVIAPGCMLLAEEFCSWDDARRRIDLLALDDDANLVVIELKRTEDGGHLDLQALRYAAMVSTMTFEQAVDAHAEHLRKQDSDDDARTAILRFLGWDEPNEKFGANVRIILVAANFSKEVTTTVLWLNDHDLDIQCVRLQPYEFRGDVLVDVQQIIPLPEAAQYQIQVRARKSEERRAMSSARNYTKFNLTLNGRTQERVNKRQAVLRVVRALVDAGVSPEQIAQNGDGRTADSFFASTEGELNSAEFIVGLRETSRRSFDPRRWFCSNGELLYVRGRTYAVSNQWGARTEDMLRRLAVAFPQAKIRVESAEE